MATMGKYRVTGIVDGKFLVDGGSGDVVAVDVDLFNKLDMKTMLQTIEFDGDGKKIRRYSSTGLEGKITADTYDAAMIETIFGKTVETTGLPGGVAKRMYGGDDTDRTGIVVGFEATATAELVSTGASIFIVIGIPRLHISPPPPIALQNIGKAPLELDASAEQTTMDIAGNTLPGTDVGPRGVTYYIDELS